MKNNKNLLLAISFLLLALGGCGGAQDSSSGSKRRVSPQHEPRKSGNKNQDYVPVESPQSFDDGTYSGRVLGSGDFQAGVDGLVSSFMTPTDEVNGKEVINLGHVSGVQGDETGVWFNGQILVSTSKFDPYKSYSHLKIQKNSFINVLIWDSFAGKDDSNGNMVPGIKIGPANLLEGEIQGNQVNLRFEYKDPQGIALGQLQLEGSYNAQNFSGIFYFYNEKFHHPTKYILYACGNKGACGRLGSFHIRTCDVFNCK